MTTLDTRPIDLFEGRGRGKWRPSIADRIDAAGDCWEWTGRSNDAGYGVVLDGQRVHRVVWEALVGEIPDGMTIDHLCRNAGCCNPDHLEVVSQRENVLRGFNPMAKKARQTRCHKGHPLSGDNLTIEKYSGRESRRCKQCKNERRI